MIVRDKGRPRALSLGSNITVTFIMIGAQLLAHLLRESAGWLSVTASSLL